MNHFIESSMSFVKTFTILSKLGWILFIELFKYLFGFHKNFEMFIVSITNKLIQINILYNIKITKLR